MTREEAAQLLWRVAHDKYGPDDNPMRQREAADIVVTALREKADNRRKSVKQKCRNLHSETAETCTVTQEQRPIPKCNSNFQGGNSMSDTRYPTRMHEILMEEKEMTPEERLLREIFAKSEQDEMPDNYPETYFEKADYAMHCMHKSLESISPALGRISRLCGLLRLGEKDGKNTTPRIITHNESRMALKHLAVVKRDVDDAYQEILSIFENTKEPETVSETESVDQKGGN